MARVDMPAWATKTKQDAAKAVVDDTNTRVQALQTTVAAQAATIAAQEQTIAALEEGLSKSVYSSVCRVTVRVNPSGSSYELPDSDADKTTLLNGAQIVFEPLGSEQSYVASVERLENFQATFTVYVSAAARISPSPVKLRLGKSASVPYAAAGASVVLTPGGDLTVDITTHIITGTVVEIGRVQFFDPSAADAGESAIITRITTGSGTVDHFGGYASDGVTWIDKSMTKVSVWNCADASATPTERVISDGGSENAIDIMQRLATLRNIKKVIATYTGDSASIQDNVFIRFDPVYTKTEYTELQVPTYAADGTTVASTTTRACIIKWLCDTQADAEYHLHPLFERYETQPDNSIAVTPLAHGYIARYPIQSVNLTVGGVATPMACSRSDGSREVGNSRQGFLNLCKNVNKATVTISADGESDIVVAANSDGRFASMCNLCDIDFLSLMAFMFFGSNVQASLRGICTNAVSSTSNGATDYLRAKGIWNGGANTDSNQKSIVFLGVEDATWSSTGWMHPDWINLWKRVITTDANGAVASNTTVHEFLFCQDRAKYNPCGSSANYNNVTATEAELKLNGYRVVSFTPSASGGDGYKRRLGYDPSPVMRDAFLPTANAADHNINMGGADYMWSGSAPSTIGTFSATASYAIGAYVVYDSKVYKCIVVHQAAAWDATHFELQANKTGDDSIVLRNWYMVARGNYRDYGGYLGIAFVSAGGALSGSSGSNWRSRVSLQPLQ